MLQRGEADAFPDYLQGVLLSRALQQKSSAARHLLLPGWKTPRPLLWGSGRSSMYPNTAQARKLPRHFLFFSVSARNCAFVASNATH